MRTATDETRSVESRNARLAVMANERPIQTAAQKKAKSKTIAVPAMDVRRIKVGIRSMDDSPLLVQNFSEKSKAEMVERQTGAPKAGKAKRNPVEEFVNSLWWMEPDKMPKHPAADDDPNVLVRGQRFGVPARLFKRAVVDAGDKRLGLSMKMLKGAFYVNGALVGSDNLVPITGTPTMDMRHVRLASGSADVRFRGFFAEWSAVLDIQYDASAVTEQQLLALISQAGWRQGICDFRPATCGGDFGRFVLVEG